MTSSSLLLLSLALEVFALSHVQGLYASFWPTRGPHYLKATKDNWSIADDWSSLSSESVENAMADTSKLFNQDMAVHAANELQAINADDMFG